MVLIQKESSIYKTTQMILDLNQFSDQISFEDLLQCSTYLFSTIANSLIVCFKFY